MLPESLLQAERLTLGVLLCGVAALAFSDFVSPAYWLLVMGASLLRLTIGPRFRLSEMHASLLGWAGFFWVGLELAFGRAWIVAFTDFLLILSLAVCVEAPTPRNHLHRLITGLFLILAGSVLTDSVLYALPLAGFLLLMWRACRRLYGLGPGPGPGEGFAGTDLPLGGWRPDLRAFAAMLIAATLLFFLVPRAGPGLMLKNVQPKMAASGFSDTVELGDFARWLDPAVAMRVEAPGMKPSRARVFLQGRYWRGIALSRFDGKNWRQVVDPLYHHFRPHQSAMITQGRSGQVVSVYREAVEHPYIMLPDGILRVNDLPQQAGLTANASLKFRRTPQRRLRLLMVLGKAGSDNAMRPPVAEEKQKPESEVIAQWSRQTIRGATNVTVQAERLTQALKGWAYNLDTSIDEQHPVEHFLLKSRSGHCEMFASALALSMRSLGIPARVVNGYYGGEWNDMGGFLLIRQQHAHAWVEAWVNERWQRFDPTPASRWALSGVRFIQWDHAWETVRLAWYRYVLEFQNEDRGVLLGRLKSWFKAYGGWLVVSLVLAFMFWRGFLFAGRRVRPGRNTAWRLLDRWLGRHGVGRVTSQPLRLVPLPQDIDVRLWRGFVVAWETQAYGIVAPWSSRELKRQLRALSPTA
ncbi:MAG: DUF3488 and transglutaminase-like domain-containing protein [Mariprofundaceae bacterium]|nr:DUF3488 and transglutaminase-like domain-containing protein [Mariprofundaceae bacterium]